MADTTALLSAMIAPAVLVSACGTLLLSTSNRIVRVIDKVHNWSDRLEGVGRQDLDDPDTRELRLMIFRQLDDTARRVNLLRLSMTAYYAAVGVFVLDIILIGTLALLWGQSTVVSVIFGLVGASLLLVGSVSLIMEAQIAVSSTQREMEEIRKLAQQHVPTTTQRHPAMRSRVRLRRRAIA